MASLDFNIGPHGFSRVLEKMNITAGIHLNAHAFTSTKRRLSDAIRHTSTDFKKARKRRKLLKAGLSDKRHAKEGVVYKSGGFND